VIEVDKRVRLYERRCDSCGRFWACEFELIGECPMCAHLKIEAAEDGVRQMKRTVRAIRGAMTRKKKYVREKA
jgi:hypothetical protein